MSETAEVRQGDPIAPGGPAAPEPEVPEVDVCCCSLDTPLMTEAALRTLLHHNRNVRMRVLLHVPAACSHWTRPLCAALGVRFGVGVELVETEGEVRHEYGLSRLCLQHVRAPYAFLLDSDVTFHGDGLLGLMLSGARYDPQAWAVCANGPSRPYQHHDSGGYFFGETDMYVMPRLHPCCLLVKMLPKVVGFIREYGFGAAVAVHEEKGRLCFDTGALLCHLCAAAGLNFLAVPETSRYAKHWNGHTFNRHRYRSKEAAFREIIESTEREAMDRDRLLSMNGLDPWRFRLDFGPRS